MNSRLTFEKWWFSHKPCAEISEHSMAFAWAAWQAALSSAPSAEPVAKVRGTGRDRHIGVTDVANWGRLPIGTFLYTAPPNLSAAVAAAIEQAAQVCDDGENFTFAEFCEKYNADSYSKAIRALQTEDGLAALEDTCLKVARTVL